MKDTSKKILPIYSLGAVVIASVVRFFQYSSIIDFNTGFYVYGAENAGSLIYILLAVFAAAFIVLAAIGKKSGDAAYNVSSDGMGEHATQFLGFSELIAAVLTMLSIFSENNSAFRSVGIVVCTLSLVISGFMLLRNIEPPALCGHLKLIGAVFLFLRAADYFSADLTILYHSDHIITLIAYVLVAAFFASAARFYSRLETKNSRLREIITAGLAFIVSGVHVLSKLLGFAFGGTATSGMESINPDIAAGAVLSGVFLGVLFFTKKSKDIVVLAEDSDDKKKKADK